MAYDQRNGPPPIPPPFPQPPQDQPFIGLPPNSVPVGGGVDPLNPVPPPSPVPVPPPGVVGDLPNTPLRKGGTFASPTNPPTLQPFRTPEFGAGRGGGLVSAYTGEPPSGYPGAGAGATGAGGGDILQKLIALILSGQLQG